MSDLGLASTSDFATPALALVARRRLCCHLHQWWDCVVIYTLNWGHFWHPADVWQCLETFLAATTGGGRTIGILWIEAMGAAQHSTMYKRAPPPQQRIISSAEIKKPWSRSVTENGSLDSEVSNLQQLPLGVHLSGPQLFS